MGMERSALLVNVPRNQRKTRANSDLVLCRILAWVLKKECVHIGAQRVPYSGIVPRHQV